MRISDALRAAMEQRGVDDVTEVSGWDGLEDGSRYLAFVEDSPPWGGSDDVWVVSANNKRDVKSLVVGRYEELRQNGGRPDLMLIWDTRNDVEVKCEVLEPVILRFR